MHSDAVLILIFPIRKRKKKYHGRVIYNTEYFPEKNHCSEEKYSAPIKYNPMKAVL